MPGLYDTPRGQKLCQRSAGVFVGVYDSGCLLAQHVAIATQGNGIFPFQGVDPVCMCARLCV
jgi:hypothetical protein